MKSLKMDVRGFVNQVKTMLIPGKYRQASFVDVPFKDLDLPSFAKLNSIIHTPSEITVHKDAKFEIDFEGANRWGWHPFQCDTRFDYEWNLGNAFTNACPK